MRSSSVHASGSPLAQLPRYLKLTPPFSSPSFQGVILCLIFVLVLGRPAAADHVPFRVGDVFVSVSNGKVQHRDGAGALLETLDTLQGGFTTGMAFDSAGNLYVTGFSGGNVRKFDNRGRLIGTFGIGYSGSPESILFDANGNVYVGSVNGDNRLRKFDAFGNPLGIFTLALERRGSDWIDLAADQCTLFYTSEGAHVKRFDVCANSQRADFNSVSLPNPVAYALRLLPSGGLVVADTSVIVRLDATGNIIQTYDAPGENCWFALNLDPDGKSFWSADFCSANVYKFDIQSGQQLLSFNTGSGFSTVFGLAVFGELTVGEPSNLHATVGNLSVFLYWDPPREPVDGYNIFVSHFENGQFVSLGTVNPSGTLIRRATFRVFGFANGQFPENGELYRFTVAAVKDGLEGAPSDFVLARPGEFAVSQPLLKPSQVSPLVFVHGILSDGSTWDTTRLFFTSTLRWTFGGSLSYRSLSNPQSVDPTTTEPTLSSGFKPTGDFFTVTFGDDKANYTDRRGLLHQSDEVAAFLRMLKKQGLSRKSTIVAHSMGGLASRAYIAHNSTDATNRIAQFVTYGSPHWGGSFASLGQFASDGARDLDFDCTNGYLDYSDNSFLNNLRNVTLSSGPRYFLLRGHNDWPTSRIGGCLSRHWDGIIPLDSADLVSPQAAPVGQPLILASPPPLLTTARYHTDQPEDFSAILCALDLNCYVATVRSPVEIQVTAPDGRSVARQIAEVPAASHIDIEDLIGHHTTSILIPFPLGGNYSIQITPKPGASVEDTYTLEVMRAGITTIIAQG